MIRTVQQYNQLSIATREELALRMGYVSPSEALRHACEWAEEVEDNSKPEHAQFEDWMIKYL